MFRFTSHILLIFAKWTEKQTDTEPEYQNISLPSILLSVSLSAPARARLLCWLLVCFCLVLAATLLTAAVTTRWIYTNIYI